MAQWFRSWHGAPTDTKWRTIARRSGVPVGYVTAIVWVLLDRASQAEERGSIAGYDAEEIADALGFEPEQVEAVIRAMHDKEVLQANAFAGWSKHQPAREDGSAERAKAWRDSKRTQANAGERTKTPREDTDTETDTEEPGGSSDAGASARRGEVRKRLVSEARPDLIAMGVPERDVPGVIGRWLRDTNDDEARVLDAIARARDQDAHEPVAFVTGYLKERTHDRTDRNNVVAALRRIRQKLDAVE